MTFTKPGRYVDVVFLHCSATDNPAHDDVSVIRGWHVNDNGWSDVGYHAFCQKSGNWQEGRDLEKIPAAQSGHNEGSIALCLSGLEDFTEAQFDALRDLCGQINDAYGGIRFRGHCEVSNKSCPVFDYRFVLGLDADGFMTGTGQASNPEATPEIEDGVWYRFTRIEALADAHGSYQDIAMHARVGRNLYEEEQNS